LAAKGVWNLGRCDCVE